MTCTTHCTRERNHLYVTSARKRLYTRVHLCNTWILMLQIKSLNVTNAQKNMPYVQNLSAIMRTTRIFGLSSAPCAVSPSPWRGHSRITWKFMLQKSHTNAASVKRASWRNSRWTAIWCSTMGRAPSSCVTSALSRTTICLHWSDTIWSTRANDASAARSATRPSGWRMRWKCTCGLIVMSRCFPAKSATKPLLTNTPWTRIWRSTLVWPPTCATSATRHSSTKRISRATSDCTRQIRSPPMVLQGKTFIKLQNWLCLLARLLL